MDWTSRDMTPNTKLPWLNDSFGSRSDISEGEKKNIVKRESVKQLYAALAKLSHE